jgi:hypothetical protein
MLNYKQFFVETWPDYAGCGCGNFIPAGGVTMKRIFLAALAAVFLATAARASDPVGVYALIDKVVLEPKGEAAQRVKIWGAFCVATRRGDEYTPPQRGYLYLAAPRGQEATCRTEWVDLKRVADTGQVVAFGSRYGSKVAVRRPRPRVEPSAPVDEARIALLIKNLDSDRFEVREKAARELEKVKDAAAPALRRALAAGPSPEARRRLEALLDTDTPDAYPVGFGLTRVRGASDYAPIRDLLALPAPIAPADGDLTPPGKVTLVAHPMVGQQHRDARYIFEIADDSGHKETSDPVAAGDREMRWSPKMAVKAGELYTWRVWAVDGQWKGPAAEATIRGKAAP